MSYNLRPHRTQNWTLAKPGVTGSRGVVTSHSLAASEAGIAILDAGGNAVDAALAMAFALGVVEPWNSGLGGIGFALVQRAGEQRADLVDFGPRAPLGLTADRFVLTGQSGGDLFPWPAVQDAANERGPLSFAIPAAVAGYAMMHERWGRLPYRELIAPAIALAKRGLPIDWYTTLKVSISAAILRNYPESARIYLPGGLPPNTPYQGVTPFLKQGALADTLEQLARAGLRDFYEGDVAHAIAMDTQEMGGVLSADDLARCKARVQSAKQMEWRGHVWQLAGGLTAAPTLEVVLQRMTAADYSRGPDAAWFSDLARAMREAYAKRLDGVGDTGEDADSCTTHLNVCDADGTMVSLTTTLLSSMGSRVVLPKTGILMNNGVLWFDPRPGQANSIAPGKRPLTNMCPVIVARDGKPWIAAGSSGGRRIMASVIQALSFVADFGMSLHDAAHHPRIDVSGLDGVNADWRLPADVLARLHADGGMTEVEHNVLPINFACPSFIAQNDAQKSAISDVMSPWSAALAQV